MMSGSDPDSCTCSGIEQVTNFQRHRQRYRITDRCPIVFWRAHGDKFTADPHGDHCRVTKKFQRVDRRADSRITRFGYRRILGPKTKGDRPIGCLESVDPHILGRKAATANLALDQVHRGIADKAGDKHIGRLVVNFGRGADLLHHTAVHHHHPVGKCHRLDLVVRHIDCCYRELMAEVTSPTKRPRDDGEGAPDRVKRMRVSELRQELTKSGLDTDGARAELEARLREQLGRGA